MKRGTIVTVAAGGGYAGKPRPAIVVQDSRFDATASLTVCLITSTQRDAPLIRLPVNPTPESGLREPCYVMVDKIMTVPRDKIGDEIGRLAPDDIIRLNRSLMVFLGLAD